MPPRTRSPSSTRPVNGTPALVTINLPGGGMQNVQDHGTAVVGIMSSSDDGVGTTGLVPGAMVRLSTEWSTEGTSRAAAISTAAAQFWRGSVVLLEMQMSAGFDCNGDGVANGGDLVPAEWDSAVKDVIRTAVANGRIVVEAAGNGNCDLDHASFGGAFSVSDASEDSGAILVGAGDRDSRDKLGFSTFGARVDTQGQGHAITSTGYGDLYNAEGLNAHYTSNFAGTSGASPMVTSVAVALAGILWEYHGSIYDPREMRDLLRRDGTPQGTGGHIGRRQHDRRCARRAGGVSPDDRHLARAPLGRNVVRGGVGPKRRHPGADGPRRRRPRVADGVSSGQHGRHAVVALVYSDQ